MGDISSSYYYRSIQSVNDDYYNRANSSYYGESLDFIDSTSPSLRFEEGIATDNADENPWLTHALELMDAESMKREALMTERLQLAYMQMKKV